MRAAIYTRLSQDRDGTKTGTDRQEADCRALCEREGLAVARVFTDDDRSAYGKKRRPAFEEMLASLDQFDALVFWKVDRLVRRTVQFWRVVEACDQANVRLVSIVDPIDTSTPLGKGVAGMVASMGEQESHNIATRVARADAENARNGKPHGGRRPLGYEAGGMTIEPHEAALLRGAAKRVLAGETVRSIAVGWNRQGVTAATGRAWRSSTLLGALAGPRLAGLRVHHGVVMGEAAWPPIITVEEHHRLRAVLGDPRMTTRGAQPTNLLTGVLVCGTCGRRMTCGRGNNGERRYACRDRLGVGPYCGGTSIVAEPTEEIVAGWLFDVLDTSDLAQATTAVPEPSSPVAVLAEIDARLAQAADLFAAGSMNASQWERANVDLLGQRERAAAAVAATVSNTRVNPYVGDGVLRDAWPDLTDDQRRGIVMAVIDSIPIAPPTKRGQFDSDRIGEPVWRA
jgi:site-specific DNA recombinase